MNAAQTPTHQQDSLFQAAEVEPPPAADIGQAPPTLATDNDHFIQVVLREPLDALTYALTTAAEDTPRPGQAVQINLRGRDSIGYILRESTATERDAIPAAKIKHATLLPQEHPPIPQEVLGLLEFAARYYKAPLGALLNAALPLQDRLSKKRYRLTADHKDHYLSHQHASTLELYNILQGLNAVQVDAKGLTARGIHQKYTSLEHPSDSDKQALSVHQLESRLRRACKQGWLEIADSHRSEGRWETLYRRLAPDSGTDEPTQPALRASQQTLLDAIDTHAWSSLQELKAAFPNTHLGPRLKRLVAKGLLETQKQRARIRPQEDAIEESTTEEPLTLTDDQVKAISAVQAQLESNQHRCFLLQGVTGSGKTEVYMQLIQKVLDRGQKALVLVPEIALTPQLGARFAARFGSCIATFHSGLSVAERRDEWMRVLSGEAQIALGARSAVFLPLTSLGLIVVDEEHESSFKQDEAPAYNGRDLAIVRAHHAHIPIVLGSATPSLESRHNASLGRYTHLELTSRPQARSLPSVQLVPLSDHRGVEGSLFSRRLLDAISNTLLKQEQVILFLNRRGYAPYVYCKDCGETFQCPDCAVSLTLHHKKQQLICHYCGHWTAVPEVCPGCHSLHLIASGIGTERIQQDLERLVPEAKVLRMDRDTVHNRRQIGRVLTAFRKREANVLVGTQMVSKGHDFPGVTLVGILMADASLHFPDFRAAERTFQLVTQVAGRAGRADRPGHVLCQCYDPEHPAIRRAQSHDYEGFYAEELQLREALLYPPFSKLALIRCSAQQEHAAKQELETLSKQFHTHFGEHSQVELLGPVPAPLARIRQQWRFQALVRAPNRAGLEPVLHWIKHFKVSHPSIRLALDVDPVTML